MDNVTWPEHFRFSYSYRHRTFGKSNQSSRPGRPTRKIEEEICKLWHRDAHLPFFSFLEDEDEHIADVIISFLLDWLELRDFLDTVSFSDDVRGGGTRREFGINITQYDTHNLDSYYTNGNKWFAVTKKPKDIVFSFKEPVLLKEYQLQIANDCPHRDPKAWQVYCMSEDGTPKLLHRVSFDPAGDWTHPTYKHAEGLTLPRFSWHSFELDEECPPTKAIFFHITNPAREVQLAAIRLLGRKGDTSM